VTASKLQVADHSFWYHWNTNEMNFNVIVKFLRKYDHIRKLNFEATIKSKLNNIFQKFLLNLIFLQQNSILLRKNWQKSKINFKGT